MGGGKSKPATTQLQLPTDPTFKAIMNEWLGGMKEGNKNYTMMQQMAGLPLQKQFGIMKESNPDWAETLTKPTTPRPGGAPMPGRPGKGGWPERD